MILKLIHNPQNSQTLEGYNLGSYSVLNSKGVEIMNNKDYYPVAPRLKQAEFMVNAVNIFDEFAEYVKKLSKVPCNYRFTPDSCNCMFCEATKLSNKAYFIEQERTLY